MENSDIRKLFVKQDIFRIGAEMNVNPAFALRAGYQYHSSPYAGDTSEGERNIGSIGAGYVWSCGASDMFVDLTYQQLSGNSSESFSLYGDTTVPAPVGIAKTNNWKLLLSVGFRF